MDVEPQGLTTQNSAPSNDCERCDGKGWYAVLIGIYGDSEQVQCEACYGSGREQGSEERAGKTSVAPPNK